MWNNNNPNNLNELCQITLTAARLGRLLVQRQIENVDALLKANGVESNLTAEYSLYAVKAHKEAAVLLGQKTPPLVVHVEKNKDF